MKVLFSSNHLMIGGIETLMLRMAENLKTNNNIELIFFFFAKDFDKNLLDQFQKYSKVYFLEDYFYFPSFLTKTPFIIKYLFPIKKSKIKKDFLDEINHIHASNLNSVLFANRMINLNKNITYSIGIYSFSEYIFEQFLNNYFARKLKKLVQTFSCKNFFFVNEVPRTEYSTVYGNQILNSTIGPLGIDLEKYKNQNLGQQNKRIVSIGRLTEWKTYNYHMIEVIRYLNTKDIFYSYDCYGEGTELKKLNQKVMELNLQNQIKFHPSVPYEKFNETIQNSLLFIGAGTASIEASACGIPSLTGIENLDKNQPLTYGFLHEITGYSYQDSQLNLPKKDIYKCILELANSSQEEYLEVCKKAKNRSKDFDIKKTLFEFEQLATNSEKHTALLNYREMFLITCSMLIHLITNIHKKHFFRRL